MSWPLEALAVPFAVRQARVGGGVFCATRAPRYSRGAVYHVDVIVKDVIPIRLLGQTPLKKYMMRGEAKRRTSKQVRRASRNISLQDATPIYARLIVHDFLHPYQTTVR